MWNEASAKPCTRILFLQLLLGVLLLGGVFLLAVNEDIAATQRTMVNTVNYVKEQCNRYSRIGLADESKSLMRIVESANQTAHRLEETTRPVSADFLHTCVKDCYVSGILLLDEAGNITAASEAADMAAFVHENLDSEALLNTARYPEKRYAVRLFCPEGCYLDLAAVQRLDAPGIVVAYYHTPLDYINSFSLSISSLLSGYDPAENGTIVVSSGNEIIASNEESFIGGNTDASAVLEEIRAASVSDRLVSARENGVRYFGLMEHGRNVYVYAYLPQRAVFRTTPENMLFAMVIYLVILAAIRMVRWKTAQSYREKQLAIQKEYTEQLQLKNEQLYAAVEQADRANAAKTSFLSRMSHDIRTPMNAIIGFSDLLEKHLQDEKKASVYLKKLQSSGNLLMTIINQVLEIARIESGTATLRLEAEDMEALFHSLYTVFESDIQKKGLHYSEEIHIRHKYAICDKTRLQEIQLNIVSNAIKYTPSGHTIHISLNEAASDDKQAQYVFTCTDTGIGMSEEFLSHIFEEFSREETSAKNEVLGTGLGLPIVKSIIELMEGTIQVESKQNIGTKITITLPFYIAEKKDVYGKQETKKPSLSKEKPRRILLAEDNALNAEIALELLKGAGFLVEHAADGQACVDMLSHAEDGYYDLIPMDIQMPILNGYEATKKSRQLENRKKAEIPILAMTANAFSEDQQAALEADMNDHVAKPIDMNVLLQVMMKYLSN